MSFTRTSPGYPPPRLPRGAWALLVLTALEGTMTLVIEIVRSL